MILKEFKQLEKEIFEINSEADFNETVLRIFHLQYKHNSTYKQFVDLLGKHPESIIRIEQIPFLPISFFKNKNIILDDLTPETIFSSSSTTGTGQSFHPVAKLNLYEESFVKAFHQFYGDIEELTVFALLPSYLERNGSSLVYMADYLIKKSKNSNSGFYLYNHNELVEKLNATKGKKILLGVSFALLDLVENNALQLNDTLVMETGGMKGKREELTRQELHNLLTNSLGVNTIHSEYGMTELLSQAYSKKDGLFECPPWMKILIRNTTDPLEIISTEKTGCINVIDLANLYSCSFIATDDIGKVNKDGLFEVLGRQDNSQIRGCNLMAH